MKYVPLIAAAVSRIGGKSIEFTFSSGLTSHVGYTTTSQASISLQLLWPLVNHVITHPSNSVSLQFDLLICCSNSLLSISRVHPPGPSEPLLTCTIFYVVKYVLPDVLVCQFNFHFYQN